MSLCPPVSSQLKREQILSAFRGCVGAGKQSIPLVEGGTVEFCLSSPPRVSGRVRA